MGWEGDGKEKNQKIQKGGVYGNKLLYPLEITQQWRLTWRSIIIDQT